MSNHDIHLYTAATMNGYKPVIFLEEAGVPYDLTFINFAKKEQKAPDYMKLNPNGRIPTIVDRSNNDFAVFESGAILWYLAEKYGRFLPSSPNAKSETLQWLMFQMGGVGPMMGQAMYFQRIAAPNGQEEPFSIKRYVDETRRLLEVLNTRLDGREWLAADEYTIMQRLEFCDLPLGARLCLGQGFDRWFGPSEGVVRSDRRAANGQKSADHSEGAASVLGRRR